MSYQQNVLKCKFCTIILQHIYISRNDNVLLTIGLIKLHSRLVDSVKISIINAILILKIYIRKVNINICYY